MEFFYGTVAHLLERHQALADLARYLQGDRETFFSFLENVYQFEKNLDDGVDVAGPQCHLIAAILKDRFKSVMLSQEWQRASDYFIVPSNESALLDVYYRLDIGNEQSLEEAEKLRRDLLLEAFFQGKSEKAKARLDEVTLKFVFSRKTPRWNLENINWQLNREKNRITGALAVSLGYPKREGPPIYKDLFALCGSERQAASLIALEGVHKQDLTYRTMALEILQDVDFELEEIYRLLEDGQLRDGFERWQKKDLLSREFSREGISYLRDVMTSLKKREHKYHYLKSRLKLSALELRQTEARKYEFSQLAKGKVIEHIPAIEYYWPHDNRREVVIDGACRISAGPEPEFIVQIRQLAQDGILSPRENDLEAVTRMLLYLCLENDMPRPPILPVYNALRRWLEAICGKNRSFLENLCYHARIFRPHIQIPHVGERPFAIAKKEHKLVVRPSTQPKGTIIGIEQAGVIVPDVQMPLFLQGEYCVSEGGKEKQ